MKFLYFSVFLIACVTTCYAQNLRTILVQPAPYPIYRLRSAFASPGMVSYGQQPLMLGDAYNYNNYRSLAVPTVLYTTGVNTADGISDAHNVPFVTENMMAPRARSPIPVVEATGTGSTSTSHKPRCLQSILGWYAGKKVEGIMDQYDPSGSSSLGPPPDLHGGVIHPNHQGSINPGLNQAMQALNDAKHKESEVNAANAQLNQLAGLYGGGGYGGYPISYRGDVDMEEDGQGRDSATEAVTQSEDAKPSKTTKNPIFEILPPPVNPIPDAIGVKV